MLRVCECVCVSESGWIELFYYRDTSFMFV